MTPPTQLPATHAPPDAASGPRTSAPGPTADFAIVLSLIAIGILGASTLGPLGLVAAVPAGLLLRRWWAGSNLMCRDHGHTALVDRARIFSWEIDSGTGRIVSMSGNVAEVLGYEPSELEGAEAATLIDIDEARAVLREEARLGADAERRSIVTVRHKDGHEVTLREVRLTPRREGLVRGVSVDISEFADALRFQAEHDELTGLANRSIVEQTVVDGLLSASGHQVALIVADLDRFKGINDTLGHPTGDRLLRVLAERLRASIDTMDVMARIGGDEFAFVAIGDLTVESASALAEEVHGLLTSPVAVDGLQLAVGASIGVAVSPGHGTTYADLLKCADIASYQAKHSGVGSPSSNRRRARLPSPVRN